MWSEVLGQTEKSVQVTEHIPQGRDYSLWLQSTIIFTMYTHLTNQHKHSSRGKENRHISMTSVQVGSICVCFYLGGQAWLNLALSSGLHLAVIIVHGSPHSLTEVCECLMSKQVLETQYTWIDDCEAVSVLCNNHWLYSALPCELAETLIPFRQWCT